ncbi:hypothetical protein Bandiella_00355 [Candidatus Bandiella woodruffii]|uniref:Transposase n=1 Tax=Candidatus Bandiella euplotis TaxID=1664265 RepID=A0ABZ0UJG5_9RICK|nr:hypothetical protein Bandiella_00355 [Candidatus Bandiella woodruffii]
MQKLTSLAAVLPDILRELGKERGIRVMSMRRVHIYLNVMRNPKYILRPIFQVIGVYNHV